MKKLMVMGKYIAQFVGVMVTYTLFGVVYSNIEWLESLIDMVRVPLGNDCYVHLGAIIMIGVIAVATANLVGWLWNRHFSKVEE